ncbi:hypothetical protein [Flavisolibacter ginsenosidimutans]|uniref:Outer membrane protein beta-barrel domain-containing protein n=1 Tax=Flavisolibacter ginsenosidimutans TaxID=661481 RepID=A0A5B8UEW5_9BACT|nr:hypothetical protein [Flavisolibacter ginsenosidimutans]QEC55197.1 hypothetical protein FSB75_04515 [Flavisolibacter ginsenosidimutans]
MIKSFLFLAFFFFISVFCHAQAKSVYFELGGPGLASINFDSRFSKGEAGLGGRVGIGGFSVDGDGVVFIPIGLNYIVGKDQRNYFEMGAGVTPVIGTGDAGDFSSTFGHLLFGYRMQPANGGFTFRAFINPVFGKGFFIPYYGGLSFGYKF